jgi:heme/copper-type cytochrome/quinol oxidase subunit 1
MGENNTPEESQPSRRTQLRAAVVPFVGVAVVLVGIAIAWLNRNNFVGWFAYAPLSNQPFSGPGLAFLSLGTQIGLAVAITGLLVLAFWAGYRLGRTRPATQ